MNTHRTLARPYAKAVFELACQENAMILWSQVLTFLATVAKDKALQAVYHDARYAASEFRAIFVGLLKKADLYQPMVENLILLLAYYRRLPLLPMIAALYEEHKADFEKSVQVSVTSAFPLSGPMREKLKTALEKRLQRTVNLHFSIDKTLMGGAVIRAGDWVMDSSVKSQLEKLKQIVVA